MKPSVGRIVHYIDPLTGKHCAALIIDVDDKDRVNLRVFGHVGSEWTAFVISNDETYVMLGSWHWPERV